MRLRMFSMYDFFPSHNYVDGEPYISCYVDFHVKDKVRGTAIALLIEPRSIQPAIYEYIEQNPYKFALIFTHDSILLSTLPNTKRILYGGVWGEHNESQACVMGKTMEKSHYYSHVPKTKDISFLASNKEMCHLHKMRKLWAKTLDTCDDVDCLGTFNGGKDIMAYEAYKDYKFSIVMENYIDDYWFTEKICNAFANNCVPIYYGARKIGEIFDGRGIVRVDNLYDLPDIIRDLKKDISWEYKKREDAIEYNYYKVTKFADFETLFFKTWGVTLEKLL